jgi:hypothetical protein
MFKRTAHRLGASLLLCFVAIVYFSPSFAGGTYTQNFANGTAPNWSNQISTFSAATGYYSNDNHDIALAMATYAGDTWDTDYTYSIDMDAEFGGGTDNAIGAVYNFQDTNNYYKIRLVENNGSAELISVIGGTATVLATATYNFPAHTYITVKIQRVATRTTVLINGTPVFSNVTQTGLGAGMIGVVQEWNFAKFTNISVTPATLAGGSYSQNFASGTAPDWSNQISTFSAATGYYSNDNHDIALALATYDGNTWDTGYSYSVNMDSEFGGGIGNAIGAVFNFQDTNNYYEVRLVENNGSVELISLIGGTSTVLATGTFNFPAHTYITVNIQRMGTSTTVLVNGATVINNITQAGLGVGRIGVIQEWNFAKFTNISVSPLGSHTNAFTPPFPRIGFLGIGTKNEVNFYNDATGTMQRIGTIGIQEAYAKYNVVILGRGDEGWSNGGSRDRDTEILSLKSKAANPANFKVLGYVDFTAFDPTSNTAGVGSGVLTNQTLGNNWQVLNVDGTNTPSPGNSAWDNTDYATSTSTDGQGSYVGVSTLGETPPQWYAHYVFYNLLSKNRSGTDASRFSAILPQNASANFDSLQCDNIRVDPRVMGDWKRIHVASTTKNNGQYQGTWSDILANGQRQFFDELRKLTTAAGMTSYLLGANAGEYGNSYLGNTLTTAGAMNGVLDYATDEGVMGKNYSIETFNTFANTIAAGNQMYDFLNPNGARIVMGNYADRPGDLPNNTLPWSTDLNGVNGEYQWMRYELASCLLMDQVCAIQRHPLYAPEVADLPWYDEFDNAGAGVGYLGTAVDTRQSAPRFNGVWAREFSGGLAISNPKGNGTQTVTLAQLGISSSSTWHRINGTQAPMVNNGAAVSLTTPITVLERDGLILLRN